ncbi:putative TonB-dependent receptor [uncultured Sphingopyxis sp.]|uniref:Putative TonB-dependent receptor n=1 Tax=uncultured Sphingopyxis sp. TaxID=310581 RepID=A0A1Y5PU55_9SPHN|nr:TonB-dependent receptor [uncultured Sphingopyxis sp.]SBV33511.1 putative TonB-dependent receptor [uncultured Sphingopyxis sp.]
MTMTKARWARHSSRTALVLAGIGAFAAPLAAQEAPAEAAAAVAPGEEAIVVTGSRIARETYDTPAPVIGVSSEDLLESGDSELSETLADLPQLSSTTNDATVTGNTQNSGLSSIELRSLGSNRTLVLVDGRRTVSNSGISNLVSLSTIPSDFIDRVEVITGGTSSVYGSDAVAGVVNIITKKNERGLTLRARAGLTAEGDGQELTLGATYGTRFADGRGYFLVSGTYDRDWGIRAVDREWAVRPVSYGYDFENGINEFEGVYINENGAPASGSRPASEFPPLMMSDLSVFIPGGVFSGGNSRRDRFYRGGELVPLGPDVQTGEPIDVGTTDDGNTGYFLPNRDGYNQRTGRSLILARKRYLGAAKLEYEFSDAVEAFAQLQYSRITSGETREAVGIGWDSTYPLTDPVTGITTEIEYGKIPCLRTGGCNPFVPAELRGNETPSTGAGIAWDRRFDEVGGQITENKRETIRSWAGLRGKISDSWNWEASFGYGQYKQDQWRRNEINGVHLTQALNAEMGPNGPQCADADARAAGCVAIDLFGEGAITPDMAAWIRADLHQELTIRQYTGQAFVTGELFQLPAGPVGAAFGIDYRKDSQELTGDLLSQTGGTTGNAVPNFGGSIRALEGYGEVSVPLLRDAPGAYLLSVDASARVADYNIDRVGTVFSWRGGVQYAPIPDIRFRAQFARAQRAPDIAELYSPPRGNFEAANDLCDGVTPTTAGRLAANCRLDPGIQALFAQQAADNVTQRYTQAGNNLYSPNGGNLDLKEETADTLTLGAVLAPRFVPGLTIAVDYYDIRIKDAIDAYSNRDIQLQCYDTDVPQADNPFCADITRNANNGQIVELVQRQVNLARFDTQGIDVAFNYRFRLDDALGIPGRFDLRYDGTHVLKQKVQFQGVDGTVTNDLAGDLAEGSFKYRARGSLSWKLDNFRIRWTTTYYGKINDSNSLADQYAALLETNPNAEVPVFLNIGDVWEHDLFLSFDVDSGGKEFRLYGGVNNLFNSVSPFLPSGTESGRLTNQNGVYDIAGRRFYVGATVKF